MKRGLAMNFKSYYRMDENIECCKGDIVSMVQFIQGVKSRMEAMDAHISAHTMNHVKDYIAEVQVEIDRLQAEKDMFLKCVESFRGNPAISNDEYQVLKYRYVDYKTCPEICEIIGISNGTLHRYLRKVEALFDKLFASESSVTA